MWMEFPNIATSIHNNRGCQGTRALNLYPCIIFLFGLAACLCKTHYHDSEPEPRQVKRTVEPRKEKKSILFLSSTKTETKTMRANRPLTRVYLRRLSSFFLLIICLVQLLPWFNAKEWISGFSDRERPCNLLGPNSCHGIVPHLDSMDLISLLTALLCCVVC